MALPVIDPCYTHERILITESLCWQPTVKMKIDYIYYTIYIYIIFTNTIYIIKIGFRNVVMQQVGAWKCNSQYYYRPTKNNQPAAVDRWDHREVTLSKIS